MLYSDFEYDGHTLSEFGLIVCSINKNNNGNTVSIGNNLQFNTIANPSTNKFKLSSVQYDEAYTTSFEVCKNPCTNSNSHITQVEMSALMRWLNKKSFHKFRAFNEDDDDFYDIYYNASFNVQPIVFGGKIIGAELTMQTDAPFGYYNDIELEYSITDTSEPIIFNDMSDEIGYLYYKKFEITLTDTPTGENKELVIVNSQEPNRKTIINNCSNGEVITFIENMTVSSSIEHPKLFNDFNYIFPRIRNDGIDNDMYVLTDENTENVITINTPCIVKLIYSPICKSGMI